MGAGKSTTGRILAARLARPFLDLDNVIESQTGQTIPQLFENSGESSFRDIEQRVGIQILDTVEACVLATGGGANTSRDFRARCRQADVLAVYLKVSCDEAMRRIEAQGSADRPLLAGENAREAWQRLASDRERFYLECARVIVTDGMAPADIADEIARDLQR